MTFCEAIARMEGWLISTSRCRRNHNPGNIRTGTFTKKHGAIGSDGSFAIFRNDQDGFNALSELLEANYSGDTIQEAINRYAPPIENQTNIYIQDVCTWTGLNSTTILTATLLNPPILGAKNAASKLV